MCALLTVGGVFSKRPSPLVMGLIATGLFLGAREGRGAIHYYYGDIEAPLGHEQALDLNFENDDIDDIVLENIVSSGVNYQGLRIPYSPGKIVGFVTSGVHYVSSLSVGARIDSSTLGPSYYGALAYGAEYPLSQFNDVSDSFIGLAFPVSATSLQYAWMRVSVDNAAGALHVRDWAFEDVAGVGITAGDVGSLPIYGDLNGDRRVDGGDFLAWQRGVPSAYNIFDFWKWKDNFGAGATGSLASTSIVAPEPTTIGPLAMALLCGMLRARTLAVRRLRDCPR